MLGNPRGIVLALVPGETLPTMLRWTDAQRSVLMQVLPAVANLGVGTMVFGQFLRQQPFSTGVALAGVGFWFVLVSLTLVLAGGKQ